jgi:hypothetical protein
METFSVETDGAGGLQVRSTEAGSERSHIVGSFPTLRKAQEWIDQRVEAAIRSTNASDVA